MDRYLVVGLGNPGKKLENTRHNAGFMCLDSLDLGDFSPFGSAGKSLIVTKDFDGKKVTFMKPMTYMNLSGEAVFEFVGFYKIPTDNILVILDDIYLSEGKTRYREKGSCGGHNGMRNIINILGTEKIKRLKIGVGNKPEGWDLDDWVLSNFSISSFSNVLEDCKQAINKLLCTK